jgi:serine/threonine-protein kinase
MAAPREPSVLEPPSLPEAATLPAATVVVETPPIPPLAPGAATTLPPPPSPSENGALLDELLSRWQWEAERGGDPTAADLCHDRPELAAELGQRIQALRQMNRLCREAAEAVSLRTADSPPVEAPPPPTPLPTVPGYEVLGPLGRGGMGVVYKARQRGLNRLVALKMILAGGHAGREELARFRAEAEAVARFQHPNIVQIHEVGEHQGQPFFALEFAAGGSLADKLAGTPWEARPAAALVESLARAMDAAHQRGIVHRDLKPANVLLTADGTPKVTDFGLAKRLDDQVGQTHPDAILGTPSYMAPEQTGGRAREVGPASDVYALGAILYEALTGRPPFRAATVLETLDQVRSQEPVPPRQLQPKVPRDLETICLKCLQKAPARRYASTAALADDLRRFLAGEPILGRRAGALERAAKWARRKPAAAAALALLLTAVVALAVGIAAVMQGKRRTEQALASVSQARERTRQALDEMSTQVIEDWLAQRKELEPAQRAFLERALALYEEFAQESGNAEEVRKGVAGAHMRVGKIRVTLGQHEGAEAAYRRAQDLYGSLVADFPRAPEYRSQLAKCHSNLGTLLSNIRPEEAGVAFGEALAVQKQLVAEFPGTPEYRISLAATYNDLGLLLRDIRGPKEAKAAYDDALALLKQLADEFPTVTQYRRRLAASQDNRATLLNDMGRPEEAEAAYRDALAIRRGLVADSPPVPQQRLELARTLRHLGIVLFRSLRRPKEAEAAYREALALEKPLAAEYPTVPEYRVGLAQSLNNLGNLLMDTGRPGEAEGVFRDALALKKQLADDYPTVSQYRQDLGRSYCNLGILLKTTGRPKEAEAAFGDAIAVQKQLVAEFATVADYQGQLANTMTGLAELARDGKEFLQARQLLEQARLYNQAALKAYPNSPYHRAVRRETRQLLAATLLDLGEHAAAAEAALDLARGAIDAANDTYGAACLLSRCASLAEKDTQLPEVRRKELARSYSDQAVDLLRQAVGKGYRDAAHLKTDSDLDVLRSREDFQELLATAAPPSKPEPVKP